MYARCQILVWSFFQAHLTKSMLSLLGTASIFKQHNIIKYISFRPSNMNTKIFDIFKKLFSILLEEVKMALFADFALLMI